MTHRTRRTYQVIKGREHQRNADYNDDCPRNHGWDEFEYFAENIEVTQNSDDHSPKDQAPESGSKILLHSNSSDCSDRRKRYALNNGISHK